jgi:hypothetical protein
MPNSQADAATAYFDQVRAAFLEAENRSGAIHHYFTIGGHTFCFRFAGPALARTLTRALAHLETKTGAAETDIGLWDSASTGVAPPEPPWDVQDFLAREQTCGVNGERILAAFEAGANAQLSVLDRKSGAGFYWVPSAGEVSFWERPAPVRTLLHWWLREHGSQLVHAGAVGCTEGGVLLGGKGGSGKSTVALACLEAGLGHVSDDYALLSTAGAPAVRALYSTAKLNAGHMQRTLPRLVSAASEIRGQDGKAVLFLQELYPERLLAGFPLKAVLVPRVTGEPGSKLRRVAAAYGVSAIAPSTMFQLRWAGQDDLKNMAQAIRQVPNYVLELGTDLAEAAALVRELLKC